MNSAEPLSPPEGSLAPFRFVGRAAVLSLCLSWPWAPVVALEGDQEQPVFVEADSVELDDIQDTSVYIGNVQIDQGTMRILADQVTVKHKEDRRPRFIVAVGNPVRYRQAVEGEKGEVKAHAQRMEYDAEKDELTLIDQAELTQATDRTTELELIALLREAFMFNKPVRLEYRHVGDLRYIMAAWCGA